MPGEFVVLRKEDETYEAIKNGTSMSSLCLGCGVALVSVQDALQVACPSCRAITPLNGICLHRPFGIATGVKRAVCEHLLTPKKSPFAAAVVPESRAGGASASVNDDDDDDNQSTKVPLYIASSRTRAPAREVSRIPSVAALGATAMSNRLKMEQLKTRAGAGGTAKSAKVQTKRATTKPGAVPVATR